MINLMASNTPREYPMENMATQTAKDLDSSARKWLQHLFGRPLEENEQVTFLAFPSHSAPPIEERQKAFQQMDQVLDQAATNMQNVSDDEFEDAVDEAMQHVRQRKS